MTSCPQKFAEQIAFYLSEPGFDLAFVQHHDIIYYAQFRVGAKAPSSAVIKLIQGLCEKFRSQSFLILRNRIFTDAVLTEACRGMVKVCAKRVQENILPKNHDMEFYFQFYEIGNKLEFLNDGSLRVHPTQSSFKRIESRLDLEPSKTQVPDFGFSIGDYFNELGEDFFLRSHEKILESLNELRLKLPLNSKQYLSNFQIVAILVSKNGELLEWGINSNSEVKTSHAEVSLVQKYFLRTNQKLPKGSRIYVTHKPCKMCAGMIYDWAEDLTMLKIYYSNEVSGSLSIHTILDRVGSGIQLRV